MSVKRNTLLVAYSVDYSLETIELKWIVPRDSAVQFDPGGEDDSQFIIKYFVLTNCTHNSTDGLALFCNLNNIAPTVTHDINFSQN